LGRAIWPETVLKRVIIRIIMEGKPRNEVEVAGP
jgi:hypothetical protein